MMAAPFAQFDPENPVEEVEEQDDGAHHYFLHMMPIKDRRQLQT